MNSNNYRAPMTGRIIREDSSVVNVGDGIFRVEDAWTGNATMTKSWNEKTMRRFGIYNKGSSELLFTIGTITVPVGPGQGFGPRAFKPFSSVTITTTSPYQAFVEN